MKLNIVQPPKEGDRRTLSDKAIDKLHEDDCYDSYHRVYIIQGMRWRIAEMVRRSDGSTEYTLECIGKE